LRASAALGASNQTTRRHGPRQASRGMGQWQGASFSSAPDWPFDRRRAGRGRAPGVVWLGPGLLPSRATAAICMLAALVQATVGVPVGQRPGTNQTKENDFRTQYDKRPLVSAGAMGRLSTREPPKYAPSGKAACSSLQGCGDGNGCAIGVYLSVSCLQRVAHWHVCFHRIARARAVAVGRLMPGAFQCMLI
jgi:hypothetical protein